jgi:hypothetical protein
VRTRKNLAKLIGLALVASLLQGSPAAQAEVSSGSITFERNAAFPLRDQPYLKVLNRSDSNTFEFSGDFTVESWVKFTRFDLFQQFLGQAIGNSDAWSLQMMTGSSNQLRLTGKYGDINSTFNFVANKWYHIALVRSGMATNNMKIYVNGVKTGQGTYNTGSTASGSYKTTGGVFGNETQMYTVGAGSYAGSDRFDGSISNIRYSSRAMYTGDDFVAPTSPLTADADTVLLLNTTNDDNYLKDSSTRNARVTIENPYSPATVFPVKSASSPFLYISSSTENGTAGQLITGYSALPNSETYTATYAGTAFASLTTGQKNGLSFDSVTGKITGVPTATAAAQTFVIKGSTTGAGATFTLTVTAGQTITFPTVSGLTEGDSKALTATASSGLAVTYSSSTPSVCSTSGGSVKALAGGTCTLTASQTGDATYSAAPNVSVTFGIAYSAKKNDEEDAIVLALAGVAVGVAAMMADVTTIATKKKSCYRGKTTKKVLKNKACPKGYSTKKPRVTGS